MQPRHSLPGDVAELHSDALRHAPLLRKHAAVLLLVVHQLPLDPGVAPVNFVQPGDLRNRNVGRGFRFLVFFYFLDTFLPHPNSYSRLGFPETTPGTQRGAAGWTSWWLPVWCVGPARWPPGRRLGARCWAPPISTCKQSDTGLVQSRETQAKTPLAKRRMTLDPCEGKASSKSARIWVPNSLWAAFTLEIHFQSNPFSSCSWHSFVPHHQLSSKHFLS